MKTFCIMRHGKSSWDEPYESDVSRPLMPVGIRRTQKVAKHFRELALHFDLLISSHATRAYSTAMIVASFIDYPEEDILIEESVYHGNESSIEQLLMSLNDDIQSVAIFGHNPTLTWYVNAFLDTPIDNLPTSGAAYFSADIEKWSDLPLAKVREIFLITPKTL